MVKGFQTCGLILSTCYKPRHVLMNSLKKTYMLWFALLLIVLLYYITTGCIDGQQIKLWERFYLWGSLVFNTSTPLSCQRQFHTFLAASLIWVSSIFFRLQQTAHKALEQSWSSAAAKNRPSKDSNTHWMVCILDFICIAMKFYTFSY